MIKAIIVYGSILFGSFAAIAAPVASIGTGFAVQQTDRRDQNKTLSPLNARAGYGFDNDTVALDYTYIPARSSGEGDISIEQRSHQLLLWLQHEFVAADLNTTPYIGAGVGGLMQTVRTRAGDQVVSSTGQPEAAGELAAGLAFSVIGQQIDIGVEGRATFAGSLRPSPMLGAAGMLSYRF